MSDTATAQVSMTLDLKQFFASLEKMEGVSKESVAQLQQIFGKVPSVQVPFDSKQIEKGFKQINESSKPAITGMSRAAQSTQSLNYIMRDSPYFFQSFNMGLMAVGNNLNPFIDQMLLAKKETGSWKGALTTLGSGLTGIGGISFMLSTVVTALTSYSLWSANSERETKKLKKGVDETKDSIEELKKAIEGFSTFTLKLKRDSNQAEIDAIDTAARLKIEEITKAGGRLLTMEEARSLIPGSFKYKQLTDENKLYDEQIKKLGYIPSLQLRIEELLKEQNNLKETDLKRSKEITKEIEGYQKLITDFQGKTKDKKTKETKFSDEITIMKDYIGYTDSMIRSEIKLNQAKLNDPNFKGDRVAVLEKIIMLNKRQQGVTESYLRLFDIAKSKGYNGRFDMKPLENIPKISPMKESTEELERMLYVSNSLTDAFNQATQSVASMGAEGVRVFNKVNSLAEQFITTLVKAIVQTIILKGILLVTNLLSGGAPSAITPIASFIGGGDSSLSGGNGISNINNLEKSFSVKTSMPQLSNTALFRTSQTQIVPIIVGIKGFAKGRDIQFALDREATNKSTLR